MSTPTVIEITRRPEPVVHDPFIDDLRLPIRPDVQALQRNGIGPISSSTVRSPTLTPVTP